MSGADNQSRSFEILVAKAVNNFPMGWHRSLLKGSGDDFESIHQWQPGDKKMAVSATAKTGEVMTKVFQEPKQLNVWIVLDVSSSMFFGKQKPAIESAVVIASALILSAKKMGDLAGIITFDSEVCHFYSLSRTLSERDIGRELLHRKPLRAKTNIKVALERLIESYCQNSLIVIISDFLSPIDRPVVNLLRQLSYTTQTSVLALVLEQVTQKQPKCHFFMEIEDSETREKILWDEKLVSELDPVMNSYRRQIKRTLGMSGVEQLFLDINDNYIKQLARYFKKKKRFRV